MRLPLILDPALGWCSVTYNCWDRPPLTSYGVACYKIVVLVYSIKESASCLGSGTNEILIILRYVRMWKVAAWDRLGFLSVVQSSSNSLTP